MTYPLNETHDPAARSWVEPANLPTTDFPLQNLPFGVFRRSGDSARIGVAIGDDVLDLMGAVEAGFLAGLHEVTQRACAAELLNPLMALDPEHWSALRLRLFRLLNETLEPQSRGRLQPLLIPQAEVSMQLPAKIGDYTDFYAGINHATNVGKLFRPDNPLLPNYKWIPIGYHGRASSVVVSGTEVRRPRGQTKAAEADAPLHGPTKRLDYELELGIFVGEGNALGEPIEIRKAKEHIFGFCLLNDWSARDMQAWEYQPLGPFLAKSFATSISPWVVMTEALAPYRAALRHPDGDPQTMAYLNDPLDQGAGGFDIRLEISLFSARMREQNIAAHLLCRTSSTNLYWTPAQLVAHHSSNGCNLRPGDLLGTGTISGRSREELGSLLELTEGKNAFDLPGGERRIFLEDGDEVIFRGWCESGSHRRIGFGECRGRIRA